MLERNARGESAPACRERQGRAGHHRVVSREARQGAASHSRHWVQAQLPWDVGTKKAKPVEQQAQPGLHRPGWLPQCRPSPASCATTDRLSTLSPGLATRSASGRPMCSPKALIRAVVVT